MRAVPLHGGVFIGYETIKKLMGGNQYWINIFINK